GPKGVDLIMATSDTATESGAIGSYSAFDATMADWRKTLVSWRCGLSEADRHRFGVPPGWNCRDVEFFISKISFDSLGPDRSAALHRGGTRFQRPADQSAMLVTAGRDALTVNPKFRAFVSSLGRPPPPPAAPGAPVATSDDSSQHAAAEGPGAPLLRRRLGRPDPAFECRE